MPFFIRGRGKPASTKKKVLKGTKARVTPKEVNGHPPSKKQKINNEENDEITSDEDEEFFTKLKNREGNSQYKEIDEETPQEKKVRLAQQYLEEILKQKKEEADEDADLDEAVGLKLKEDVLEASGKFQYSKADSYEVPDPQSIRFLKCKHHKLSLTCLVVSSDEKYLFTASKDSNIVKWTVQGERIGVIPRVKEKGEGSTKGHSSCILSLAISQDGKFLCSGDLKGLLHVWDPETLTLLHTFKRHRGPVSGLAFRRGTHMLFSASHDRLVMTWNLDVMAFAESLGGHQDAITGIDALTKESCVTTGGRDEMAIVYVIPDEKQLRFSAPLHSIDGVKLVNEKTFVTFGQNGSLALFTTLKKRPHFTIKAAHGLDPISGEPFWITAVAALVNTDTIASGSLDGRIRFWKINHGRRSLTELFSLPVAGVVNGLEFTSSGSHLLVAIGQEHKLGRWYTEKTAKNALVIVPLEEKS
ncbi:UNVERIFIED_CONTAM: hypothetical protein GTU68_037435 [Idotea baltica]|nr:hypothetical protein [Idotea baltica]